MKQGKKPQPYPYFPMWARDWIASPKVRAMPSARKGIFIDLLCTDWDHDGIPDDDAECLAVCSRDATPEDLAAILPLFSERHAESGRRTHFKLNDERKHYAAFREKQAENGRKGGRPTKPNDNPNESGGFISKNPNKAPNPNPNPNHSLKNDITLVPASGSADRKDGPEAIPFDLFSEMATTPATDPAESGESAKESQRDPIPSAASPAGPCPHKEIARLWNEVMADTSRPKVVGLTAGREATMRGLWAFLEGDRAERIESCRSIFERVRASDFCMSGNFATFDWVIAPANRMKILEGNFDNRAKPAPQKHFRK